MSTKPARKTVLEWTRYLTQTTPTIVGDRTIAFASDDTITFVDTNNGEEKYYRAKGHHYGRGVGCIAGHKVYGLFAFSELALKSKIFVITYPEMNLVQMLSGDNYGRYITLKFTTGEYMFALRGYPYYRMKMWNFRSNDILIEVSTGLDTQIQRLEVNSTAPFFVAQYASQLSTLTVWETHVCVQRSFPIRRDLSLDFLSSDKPIYFTFGIDNHLYVVDYYGNLYSVNVGTGASKFLWKSDSTEHIHDCCIAFYKGGFLITGTDCNLRYLKKVAGIFKELWIIPLKEPIDYIFTSHNYDTMYLISTKSIIFTILDEAIPNKRRLHIVGAKDKAIRDFEMLQPFGEHVAVATDKYQLQLLQINTGKLISKIQIGELTCMKCHPLYPIILVGTEESALELVSFYALRDPKSLALLVLGDNPIENIQFSPSKEYIVALTTAGEFYIIKGDIGGKLDIINSIEMKDCLTSFAVLETETDIRILAMAVPAGLDKSDITSTNNFVVHTVNKAGLTATTRTDVTSRSNYHYICSNGDHIIGCSPLERSFDILQLEHKLLLYVSSVRTLHQVKFFQLGLSENSYFTWGLDGTIWIRDIEKKDIEIIFGACNYLATGIKKCQISQYRRRVICLTNQYVFKSFELRPYLEGLIPKPPLYDIVFKTETIGFRGKGLHSVKSWSELKALETLNAEIVLYEKTKLGIVEKLTALREQTKYLLDKNEKAEDIDKLDIQSFNLNSEWVSYLQKVLEMQCKLESQHLIKYIEDQDRIKKWIIQQTWNQLDEQGRKIYGIFSATICENYPLAKTSDELTKMWERVKQWRKTELLFAHADTFKPWFPDWCNSEGIPEASSIFWPSEIEAETIEKELSVLEENEDVDTNQRLPRIYTLSGTSTHHFVSPHGLHYHQMDIISYYQLFVEECLGEYDELNLKKLFNKKFKEICQLKEDRVKSVAQRNNKLRFIESELKILAELKKEQIAESLDLIDPILNIEENPEMIMKVDDNEVGVKPYISPSQQKILDEIARKEYLRLLELSKDDFRERALMQMMDGTLEKRWEDEIKKNPEKPSCLEKDPYTLTKEEFVIIREYQKQMEFLQDERDKYKERLEKDRSVTEYFQNHQIYNFNLKCGDLFLLKARIDQAIKQEQLKILRCKDYNKERTRLKNKENHILQTIKKQKGFNEAFANDTDNLEKRTQDCRYKYEQLQARDRLLDKQFRPQVTDIAPNYPLDQAYKMYKKRPKLILKSWATSALLNFMATKVINKDSTRTDMPLPEECYEYLISLELLDQYTLSASIIDHDQWMILCRMRRQKIESEFRIKACAAQLAEAEACFNAYSKELQIRKNSISALEQELQEEQKQLLEFIQNRYIQLILPMGRVEVNLTGEAETDFENCLLLHIRDIDEINEIIKEAGIKKINTMQRLAVFRRQIIYKEWEHKVMKMTIKDLEDFLVAVEKSELTSEVRNWLRDKKINKENIPQEASLTRELQVKTAHLNRCLKDINDEIREIEIKIYILKRQNKSLDQQIKNMSIDVAEQNLKRDILLEEQDIRKRKQRMDVIMERGRLVRRVQEGHSHIMELTTLLELQRLRTYPTLAQPIPLCTNENQ